MTRERFVADAIELTERLRARFGVERIFLAGSSWGTVLGADLVSRRPDLFHAFVAIATDVHGPRGEEISYAYVRQCLRERGDLDDLRALEEIGAPPYDSVLDVARQRQWLRRCGGMFHDPERTSFLARYGYASPEYSLLDIVRFAVGEAFSGMTMVMDLLGSVDLPAQVPRIEVPVFFFQGRHDRQTPSVLVEDYFARLDAPRGKRLFWFEDSAHDLYREEAERMQRLLVEEVLPLAERPAGLEAAIESAPLDPALRSLAPEICARWTATGSRGCSSRCGIAGDWNGRAASASRTSPMAYQSCAPPFFGRARSRSSSRPRSSCNRSKRAAWPWTTT